MLKASRKTELNAVPLERLLTALKNFLNDATLVFK
jgi:hypothetical protein